jgi:hypothetical protein
LNKSQTSIDTFLVFLGSGFHHELRLSIVDGCSREASIRCLCEALKFPQPITRLVNPRPRNTPKVVI